MMLEKMRRRALLAWGGAGVVLGSAGCLSPFSAPIGDTPTATPSAKEQCADRKFPKRHLGVIKLEVSKRPDDISTVIRFEDLPPAEREIVEQAIERERYAICLPKAPGARVEQFNSLVERIEDHTPSVPDGAYLEFDDTDYRFTHVRTGDVVFVTARS